MLTDPSYAGQIIAFTTPHIGNYGVTGTDDEARARSAAGVVVRDLAAVAQQLAQPSATLEDFLRGRIPASPASTRADSRATFARTARCPAPSVTRRPRTSTRPRVSQWAPTASTWLPRSPRRSPTTWAHGSLHVVAFDYGIKSAMVDQLARRFTLSVVPSDTSADQVRELGPDGVFLSNGPGDPAALAGNVAVIEQLLGTVPIFGICLGHQLLATALGATTFKLPFGHHGSNHPVQDLVSGKIEITAQNHNYAVTPDSLDRAVVSHVNLNDGVIEGASSIEERCFSVQYHPEAGPGPHDARYLFDRFEHLLRHGALEVR